MLKKIISMVVVIAFFTAATVSTCRAGEWIDDWIQQKTVVSPQYFKTQKRGFGTLGSLSARWRTGVDHPVTVTPPAFKSGCGGIDMFGGGFGFMQFDYLVKKLQRVMGPAAAAFAFDLALNTLCTSCSNSVKSFTAIVDRLNGLQLDQCKASKAAVTMLASPITPGGWDDAKKSETVADFLQSTGISDLYNEIIKLGDNETPAKTMEKAAAVPISDTIKDCPAVIKDVFFTDGSILEHIAAKKSIPLEYVEMMRAFVGDINIDGANVNFQYIAPCGGAASSKKLDGFVNGTDMYKRVNVDDTACAKIDHITINGISYPSIRSWAYTMLEGIADNMAGKSAMTPEMNSFVNNIRGPIYNGLKSYVAAMGDNADAAMAADTFADLAAFSITYQMMIDFYDTINKAITTAQNIAKNSKGAKTGGNQYKCNLDLMMNTLNDLKDKRSELRTYVTVAQQSYSNKVDSTLSNIQVNYYVAKMNNDVDQSLTKHLGVATANLLK